MTREEERANGRCDLAVSHPPTISHLAHILRNRVVTRSFLQASSLKAFHGDYLQPSLLRRDQTLPGEPQQPAARQEEKSRSEVQEYHQVLMKHPLL